MNSLAAPIVPTHASPDRSAAAAAGPVRPTRASTRRASRREYVLVTIIAFPVFLAIAIAARLLPRARRDKLLGACAEGNVFSQARAMTGIAIPAVFMG
ncbi:MAG: hypothetical protein ACK50Q_18705 [Labrys sp. (in: a-proteobacteria)]|jgi:hypothetical protein